MSTFTIVGNLAKVYFIFWPYFIMMIKKLSPRVNSKGQPFGAFTYNDCHKCECQLFIAMALI